MNYKKNVSLLKELMLGLTHLNVFLLNMKPNLKIGLARLVWWVQYFAAVKNKTQR